MAKKTYTVIRPKTHDGWLEERSKGLGSSEIGTIMGVSPFSTPYKLWRLKKGLDAPIEETLVMKLGHYLEDAVAQCFSDETGATVVKNSAGDWIAVDNERDYFRVSPDRIYYPKGAKHNEENKRILECKTTRLNIDPDRIPMHWWAQVQYQLHVLGIKHASLAWLTNGTTFGYVDIDYNETFAKEMVKQLDRFWYRYIIGNEEPPATTASDTVAKFPLSKNDSCQADEHILGIYQMLASYKKDIKELTELKDTIEDELKVYMEDHDSIVGTDATGEEFTLCTWKTSKPTRKFNEKTFAKEHPDMYEQYMEEKVGSRRFIVK